jgi:hypothetical protein
MDRYNAGQAAEAIGYWEPVYRELGEQTGYRLAYDLGVAYAALGDSTHSAERLQAFLTEVDARRARGEALGAIVEKEEADARARLAALISNHGRIRVGAATPPTAAQVDSSEPRLGGFVAWVTPGEHVVVFAPGTAAAQTSKVTVQAGEIVELAPPPSVERAAPESLAPAPAEAISPAGLPQQALPSAKEPGPPMETHALVPVVVATGAGVTMAATIAAILLESHATALHDRFVAEQAQAPRHTIAPSDRQTFYEARTFAYAATGTAIGLGVFTAGLATWYFWGRAVRPTIAPEYGGARLGFEARF